MGTTWKVVGEGGQTLASDTTSDTSGVINYTIPSDYEGDITFKIYDSDSGETCSWSYTTHVKCCKCVADETVHVSITTASFDANGTNDKWIPIGTFETTCERGCDWELLNYDGGETWFKVDYSPIGRGAIGGRVLIKVDRLPDEVESREGTFNPTYNNEEIGGSVNIIQRRS